MAQWVPVWATSWRVQATRSGFTVLAALCLISAPSAAAESIDCRSAFSGSCRSALEPALLPFWDRIVLAKQTASAAELPKDVSTFVTRRDRCDHFRGEDAADAARQAEIAQALNDTCLGTDAELARLLRRHAHKPAIRDRLKAYDPNIESGLR